MENKAPQNAMKHFCPYCGNVFYSNTQHGAICTFCKLFVDFTESEAMQDQAFIASRDANAAISNMKEYDLSKIEAISRAKGDPNYMYGAAMLLLKLSDVKHSSKNYYLGGFMEDNTKNEIESHELYSRAKLLLYDTIYLCETKKSSDERLYYTEFLSYIALGNINKAGKLLDYIEKSEKTKDVASFAKMLFAIEKNEKMAEKYANDEINKGEAAAYFELARLYAKNAKLKKAKKILSMLVSNSISLPDSHILLEKINKAISP
mgnify:CR=1 FL=1